MGEKDRALIAELVKALETFAAYGAVKGGTPEAADFKQVVAKILESAPYSDDLKALHQFCNAINNARSLLSRAKEAGYG